MSVTCPHGHESETTDYCDQCGARLGAPSPIPTIDSTSDDGHGDSEVTDSEAVATDQIAQRAPASDAELCPRCGTPRIGTDRFCEADGYDFMGAATGTPTRWEVVVSADREYYDTVAPDGIEFPAGYVPRTFALDRDEILVGRRSASRGIDPGIDLSGSPEDEGISHGHAVLIRCPDGSYEVVDRGSTNGTMVNDGADLILVKTPVRLVDGDRIHIGAWTTITIRAVSP